MLELRLKLYARVLFFFFLRQTYQKIETDETSGLRHNSDTQYYTYVKISYTTAKQSEKDK